MAFDPSLEIPCKTVQPLFAALSTAVQIPFASTPVHRFSFHKFAPNAFYVSHRTWRKQGALGEGRAGRGVSE
eukprot:6176971-Pleurochrysis_carterae.AAC.2